MCFEILSLIVCYKNEQEVINYCEMLSLLPDSNKIVVSLSVNCLSEKSKFEEVKEKLEALSVHIIIHHMQKNIGYLNGMLEGYKLFIEKHPNEAVNIKWIIMGNTDIKVTSNDFVNYLLNVQIYAQDIVCVAPKIHRIFPDGYERHYDVRYKKRKLVLLYLINKSRMLSVFYSYLASKKNSQIVDDDNAKIIYEAHGSFFIIKRNFMQCILKKNWPFLMYNEEGFISNIVLKEGYKEYYDPHIMVEHQGSTTTEMLLSKKKSQMKAETYKYLIQIY